MTRRSAALAAAVHVGVGLALSRNMQRRGQRILTRAAWPITLPAAIIVIAAEALEERITGHPWTLEEDARWESS